MTTRATFNLAMADFAEGKSPEEVAQLHNVTLRTARRWMNQYFDLMGNLRKKVNIVPLNSSPNPDATPTNADPNGAQAAPGDGGPELEPEGLGGPGGKPIPRVTEIEMAVRGIGAKETFSPVTYLLYSYLKKRLADAARTPEERAELENLGFGEFTDLIYKIYCQEHGMELMINVSGSPRRLNV